MSPSRCRLAWEARAKPRGFGRVSALETTWYEFVLFFLRDPLVFRKRVVFSETGFPLKGGLSLSKFRSFFLWCSFKQALYTTSASGLLWQLVGSCCGVSFFCRVSSFRGKSHPTSADQRLLGLGSSLWSHKDVSCVSWQPFRGLFSRDTNSKPHFSWVPLF